RRFQVRLAFPQPDRQHIEVFLDRIISCWPEKPKLSLQRLAAKLGPVSYAEAFDFCQNVRRRHVLGLGEVGIDKALGAELDLWVARVRPEALNAERSHKASTEVRTTRTRRSGSRTTAKHPKA